MVNFVNIIPAEHQCVGVRLLVGLVIGLSSGLHNIYWKLFH